MNISVHFYPKHVLIFNHVDLLGFTIRAYFSKKEIVPIVVGQQIQILIREAWAAKCCCTICRS